MSIFVLAACNEPEESYVVLGVFDSAEKAESGVPEYVKSYLTNPYWTINIEEWRMNSNEIVSCKEVQAWRS